MTVWTEGDLRALEDATGVALRRDPGTLGVHGEDFGRLSRGTARAVLPITDPAQLERALRLAAERALRLTPRGMGMSQGGQSVPADGVSLDLTGLHRILEVDEDALTVRCQAGARWRTLVAELARRGLLPRVLPLNLDLTVGGVLSVGGIGATSHRFGVVAANVPQLEVVTGAGARVRCGATEEREVYDATLAGLGRCAVITSASVQLRRIAPRVRTFYLLYDELEPWLADQRALVAADRADYLEAFMTCAVQGLHNTPAGRRPLPQWFYALHVSREYHDAPPDGDEVLSGLRPYRRIHVEDNDTGAFAARYEPRFEVMRRTGAWQEAHPWLEAFVPVASLGALLPRVLAALPLFLGDGHRLMFVNTRQAPRALALPQAPEVAALAVLPAGLNAAFTEDALRALGAVHHALLQAGGKRYLSGWLGMMDAAAWRQHHGAGWDAWVAARRRWDPAGVLDSVLTRNTGA
ncbi:MAG: FAD-binding oxidoreductase [Myxococcota bacterium]